MNKRKVPFITFHFQVLFLFSFLLHFYKKMIWTECALWLLQGLRKNEAQFMLLFTKMFYAVNGFIMESHQKDWNNFFRFKLFSDFMNKNKTKQCKEEKRQQASECDNLQWTTSLHLSSIALSGMNGFSERHVKYFPSSSTTGMNVRTLNDWLPVSENCGNEWKMIWKLGKEKKSFCTAHFMLFKLKLSCYQWKFMKHFNHRLRFHVNRQENYSAHASFAW